MGNIVNKYKVNELAKDFGMQTKQIIEILSKYFDTPKKSGQNLTDQELTVVFEHLTQTNQVSSIESIYADTALAEKAKPAPAESPAPKGRDQGGKKPQNGRGGSRKDSPSERAPASQGAGPAGSAAESAGQSARRVPGGAQDQGGGHPQGHQCQPG